MIIKYISESTENVNVLIVDDNEKNLIAMEVLLSELPVNIILVLKRYSCHCDILFLLFIQLFQ